MISRIFLGFTWISTIVGAYFERLSRGAEIASAILPKICFLPSCACARACFIISNVIDVILISIWRAVIPFAVPATLKSISPRWSSSPIISVRIANLSPSLIKPIAIPATGAFTGIPASIIAKLAPQVVAIDDEPFDSVISDTTRIVYGNSASDGSIAWFARHASLPCPISRRPGEPSFPHSPTENGGKL